MGVGSTNFCRNCFVHSTETYRRGTLPFQKVSGYQKTSCLRGEYQDILSIIGSQSTLKFRRKNFQCCKKLLMTQNFRDKRRREGVSRFSVENVLAQSAEKYCREPLCFKYFLVSLNVMDRRGNEGVSRLSVQNIFFPKCQRNS